VVYYKLTKQGDKASHPGADMPPGFVSGVSVPLNTSYY